MVVRRRCLNKFVDRRGKKPCRETEAPRREGRWRRVQQETASCLPQVLDAVLPVMNPAHGSEKTVFRARFSSITDTDICNAMARLGEPDHNEALSVDARQELDLRIGCAFTRCWSPYL